MEGPPRSETPSSQEHPSESATSTSPTTPISVQTPHATAAPPVVTPTSSAKPASRTAVPALPLVPALPKASPRAAKAVPHVDNSLDDSQKEAVASSDSQAGANAAALDKENAGEPAQEDAESATAAAPVKAAPKLWTGLFAKSAQSAGAAQPAGQNHLNGGTTTNGSASALGSQSFSKSNATSLAEALQAFQVGSADKIAFLEPRGLINTGNMCYMNSVSTASLCTTSRTRLTNHSIGFASSAFLYSLL